MVRRRLRRLKHSSVTFTKNEPYALCLYLYYIFQDVPNNAILQNRDGFVLFLKCVKKNLDKRERLAQVLETEIKSLEKQNLLTPIKGKAENSSMVFDDSGTPNKYEQDKDVERRMDRRYGDADETNVNLARILAVSKKPVFSAIINSVVFRSDKNCALHENLSLSKKLQNAVDDISKVEFLIEQVGLSETEARYLLLRIRLKNVSEFRAIVRDADNYQAKCDSFLAADILGISENEVRKMLRYDQKLRMFGFIDEDGDYNRCLDDCIEEQSIEPYFNDFLKPLDCSSAYDLSSFSVKSESMEICLDLLNGKNPVSILFYGKPGSGKTELAKSLAGKTGKKVYIFKNETESKDNSELLGKLTCLLSMERSDSVIIVDEADSILKTVELTLFGAFPASTKGTVNKMLENNKDKVIYIINHQRQIDESTRRRFTFSIKFEAMPKSMLHSIALSKLEPTEISQNAKQELAGLLDKYHLTGASVDNLVKVVEGTSYKDDETLLEKAKNLMEENAALLTGKPKMRESVKREYDPAVLNTSMDSGKIIEMVENAAKFAEKNKGTESGIRMLFYGLSGTGKTELARYISERLGKEILLKRASDILGMYVGQNEKNIRDAFDEAERTGSILLFDEADSFFYDRNSARQSWERSTVNEFLTQMEEFSGILICTTNLRRIMEPAMQRRFHILVEFKPMKSSGIKTMLERYFSAYDFSDYQIDELEKSGSVTPGDFGSLSGRIRFMNQDDVNADFIFDELKKIQKEKKNSWNGESGNKIGFAI